MALKKKQLFATRRFFGNEVSKEDPHPGVLFIGDLKGSNGAHHRQLRLGTFDVLVDVARRCRGP